MKVFVTGVAGQLGHDVMNELAKRGCQAPVQILCFRHLLPQHRFQAPMGRERRLFL